MNNSSFPRAAGALLVGAAMLLQPLAAAAEDKVVAKLNGQDITEADVAIAEADIGAEIANLPAPTKRRVLVEYLIETKLFADAAEAEKLSADASFARRAEYWKRRALRDAFFDKSVKGGVSEGLARGIYDDKVKALPAEEEVRARHILVDTEEKIKEIADQLAKGGDFGKLASENSKDPGSKADGGNLGFFARGQMVKPFEEAAFALKAGEVSQPVKTQFGWHLIKIEEKRQKQPPSFEEVKDHLIASIAQQRAQEIATDLRGKAEIVYVDPEVKAEAEKDAARAAEKKIMDEQVRQKIQEMEAKKAAGETPPPAETPADKK